MTVNGLASLQFVYNPPASDGYGVAMLEGDAPFVINDGLDQSGANSLVNDFEQMCIAHYEGVRDEDKVIIVSE